MKLNGLFHAPLDIERSSNHEFISQFEKFHREDRPNGHVNRSMMNRSILGSLCHKDLDTTSIYTNKKKLNPVHQLALLLKKARANPSFHNPIGEAQA